jgi:tetratricopeptide (TPR) repeat protein
MADYLIHRKSRQSALLPSGPRNYDLRNIHLSSDAQLNIPPDAWLTAMTTIGGALEVLMKLHLEKCFLVLMSFFSTAIVSAQQIGKYVPVSAGSEADHAMAEINASTDPAQKLALIDKFAAGPGQGDMALVANELYVNYYLAQKQYDKVFAYGEKIFAIDPGNLEAAVNMVRAASEKGDAEKLLTYGEKTQGILTTYKASPAPPNVAADTWERQKSQAIEGNRDNIRYVQQAVYNGAYQTPNAAARADQLLRFAKIFPDSDYTLTALGVAASSYQQAQNAPKMLEVGNALLAKDPNNLGMLLLVSDYYGEKGEQLDKAEAYAQKAATLADSTPRPDSVTEEQWKQQTALQKGLALSTLGQVNIQKKNNAQAVQNFQAAAPLLKSNDIGYARNEYRLGFAYINLKKFTEAKAAFAAAASVNSPYKRPAEEKIKTLPAGAGTRRKAS